MTTRLTKRLRQGAQSETPAFERGRCRAPAPASAVTPLCGLPVVSWAALVQGVANRRAPFVLERQFGLAPGSVPAITAGLLAQGITSPASSSDWIPGCLPSPMARLHTWALNRFLASTPDTAAACRDWAESFPGLVLPSGAAADRQLARLQEWLGVPGKPRPSRRPLKALQVHAYAEGGPRYWQAMVALAHVRAVVIQRLAATTKKPGDNRTGHNFGAPGSVR